MTKKLSFKNAQDKVLEIDKQIAVLSTQRSNITAAITIAGLTKYHRGKPRKAGVYHYSSVGCAPMGGALGYWNGKNWETYSGWGDFTNRGEVVWYGEGKNHKQPLQESSIVEISK